MIQHGYDWRRNLDLSSAELIKNLEKLKQASGEGATVIAHSMGGLVVLYVSVFVLETNFCDRY
jgi:pimeloyl-ACP methyl ester carboxylesterase